MMNKTLALAILTFLIIGQHAAAACVRIDRISVNPSEPIIFQESVLKFIVVNTCEGPRDVEVFVSGGDKVRILDLDTSRHEITQQSDFILGFVPVDTQRGPVSLSIVVTDWSDQEPRMIGKTVDILVLKPQFYSYSLHIGSILLIALIPSSAPFNSLSALFKQLNPELAQPPSA